MVNTLKGGFHETDSCSVSPYPVIGAHLTAVRAGALDRFHDAGIDLVVFSEATPGNTRISLNKAYISCVDSDSDGYGDPGYPDNTCPEDNCPFLYNPSQNDFDGDGVGDACQYPCGDAQIDGVINVADPVAMVNILFIWDDLQGPECRLDANGDMAFNIGDAVYLINFIFKHGPPPVEGCCQ